MHISALIELEKRKLNYFQSLRQQYLVLLTYCWIKLSPALFRYVDNLDNSAIAAITALVKL